MNDAPSTHPPDDEDPTEFHSLSTNSQVAAITVYLEQFGLGEPLSEAIANCVMLSPQGAIDAVLNNIDWDDILESAREDELQAVVDDENDRKWKERER